MNSIYIKDILNYLKDSKIDYSFFGDETVKVEGFSSLYNYKVGTFTWVKNREIIEGNANLDKITLAFTSEDIKRNIDNVIQTNDSKRAFFSSIEHFFDSSINNSSVGENTYIGTNVVLGENVRIGHNCSIEGEISIGDNTIIWNNVSIINKVTIGKNSEIQSGTIIGHDGFGYTEDESNVKTMIKHFGGVEIGDNVFIGSNVCIARGTIDNTVIENGTKIDNLSHIAHNCYLGKNSALAFPCFLGGSSKVEENGYIAGGIVRNQCVVHKNGFVGMGAVVIKDVPSDMVVIGNPAKSLRQVKKKG